MSSNYRHEFPEVSPDDMPAIPATWVDVSWHNDICPSFLATPSLRVWVDFVDASVRECPFSQRFMVCTESPDDSEHEPLMESDDWNAVLAFVITHTSVDA